MNESIETRVNTDLTTIHMKLQKTIFKTFIFFQLS